MIPRRATDFAHYDGCFLCPNKILRLPFPFFFCSPGLIDELFSDSGNGGRSCVLQFRDAKQFIKMKKINQSPCECYVSADKVKEILPTLVSNSVLVANAFALLAAVRLYELIRILLPEDK